MILKRGREKLSVRRNNVNKYSILIPLTAFGCNQRAISAISLFTNGQVVFVGYRELDAFLLAAVGEQLGALGVVKAFGVV